MKNVPRCSNGSQFGHDFTEVMVGDTMGLPATLARRRRIRLCVHCSVLEVSWFDSDRRLGDVDGTAYFLPWEPEPPEPPMRGGQPGRTD